MRKFFVDLYEKFIHLSWVEWTIDYCKENVFWASVIGGTLLFILVILCIMGCVRKKAKKAKKLAKKAAKAAKAQPTQEKKAAKSVKKTVAPVAEKKAAPATASVEKKVTPAAEETVTSETASIPAAANAVTTETPVKETPVVPPTVTPVEQELAVAAEEKAPVVSEKKAAAKKETKAQDVEETLLAVETSTQETPTLYEEDETEKQARYTGKWAICRVLTDAEDGEEMFFFELRASNGEKLLSSEEYTTYQGALRGIQTHKTNILNGNLKLTVSKKGDYIFKLLSGKNMLLCMGENYPTRARCESAMESTVRFAETAILDENVQDIFVKVPKEDDSPLPPLPENCNGKWIISSKTGADGETLYYFELFANNGEKLLSSEEYTTYVGAVNGIQTHKKNIQTDNFRISLTKRGDYIYKLLNGNGQLLCLGEHYKTKRLCQNAVESVKRFALSSPVLTEEKKK